MLLESSVVLLWDGGAFYFSHPLTKEVMQKPAFCLFWGNAVANYTKKQNCFRLLLQNRTNFTSTGLYNSTEKADRLNGGVENGNS